MERLALADSLLVDLADGTPVARGLTLHLQRFRAGVRERAGERQEALLDDFFALALPSIDEYARANGPAFPRFECWQDRATFRFELALRPAPQRTREIALTTAQQPAADDAHLKGPNIDRYGRVMRRLGGEALFVNDRGNAIEGTTTSFVWWREGRLMHAPSTTMRPRVASITERIVTEIAARLGYETGTELCSPLELAETELWALNALHGIRPVTHLDGAPLNAPNAQRLETFTKALHAMREPVVTNR
ncbi:aminotransferase class IV [Leucobacter sp. UCMA 4100]|uniref:aminotransferase class IV n=1 Tax=Leucobacter sp. UCMA 4100 TaxID=2810534 RepID=UPI0022EA185A|nr:aminotransferase class IV [Leucobacter sp. UCMA 4100]MDA3145935.1 aminotransferase class IV [Leucobacter sp. UCMA 4100]